MKFLKNEKGFTLVEILVVIAIIAILFITLLPQIDRAVDRARQTGVKTDFRSFQVAAETYLRETTGTGITLDGYDSFLDVGLQTKTNANFTGATDAGADSKEPDPWGKAYDVHVHNKDEMIVIRSFGANEIHDDEVTATTDNDDFLVASYYVDGTVASCSSGFGSNDIASTVLNDASTKLGASTWKCGQKLSGGAPDLALTR